MTSAVAFLVIVLLAGISYALGSINLSIIISKIMGKGDIRDYGSKNAGTTNTLRVLGKGPALLVFIWDVLKGSLAVIIARFIANDIVGMGEVYYPSIYFYGILVASLAVILGHNYPCFFGFRGGKGVATSLGVLLAIEPQIGAICLVAGLVGIILFKMVSVGSIIAAIEYPILVCIIGGHFDLMLNMNLKYRAIYITFSFVLALMVLFRHKANIERIKNGTENRLKFNKTPEEKINEEKERMQMKVEETKKEIKESIDGLAEDIDEKLDTANDKIKEEVEEAKEKIDIKLEPKKKEEKKSKKKK